jgi:hypothetical protein
VITTVSTTTTAFCSPIGTKRERRVFTSELGLDSLAVRCVPDRWQDGSNAFDELDTISVVLSSRKRCDLRSFAGPCHSSPRWSESRSFRSCPGGAFPVEIGSRLRQRVSFGLRDRPLGCTFQRHWTRTYSISTNP